MKWLLGIAGIIAAGVAGYLVEPALRTALTGQSDLEAVATPPPVEAPTPERHSPVADSPVENSPAADAQDAEVSPAPEPTLAEANPPPPAAPLDPAQEGEPERVMEEAPEAEDPEIPQAAPVSADPVEVMQASIRAGEIKEFKLEQVESWKAGEEETVEGTSFQTGFATYKAETFLGERTIQAKAFIKDGKVTRWIWPSSGMEIN